MSVDTESAAMPSATPSNPGPVSNAPAALTEPVAKVGRHLYDQVAPHVGWYFEHLEDLVHEARASRAAADEKGAPSLAAVLASLPDARILSDKPGRARIRVKALKGQDKLADEVTQALASVPGISQVEANSLTSSVLIHYDAAQYQSLNGLLHAAGRNRNQAANGPASQAQA